MHLLLHLAWILVALFSCYKQIGSKFNHPYLVLFKHKTDKYANEALLAFNQTPTLVICKFLGTLGSRTTILVMVLFFATALFKVRFIVPYFPVLCVILYSAVSLYLFSIPLKKILASIKDFFSTSFFHLTLAGLGALLLYVSDTKLATVSFQELKGAFDYSFLPFANLFRVSLNEAKIIVGILLLLMMALFSLFYLFGRTALITTLKALKLTIRFCLLTNSKNKPLDALIAFIKAFAIYYGMTKINE